MNFLAHSLLYFGDADILIGQFAGDFVRGKDLSRYPAGVARGIRLHRHVDAFADRHPATRALRAQFPSQLRRVSGIAIDIAADYHLIRGWLAYTDGLLSVSLDEHQNYVDEVLAAPDIPLPNGLRRFAGVVQRERLLSSWGTRDGVDLALERVSRRAPALAPLAACIPVVWELEERLSSVVDEVWPALVSSTQERYQQLDVAR